MGQPANILAFRKRLRNAGYFDIHIKKDVDDYWIVSACEPLGGYRVVVREKSFDGFMRRKLHGGGYVYRPTGLIDDAGFTDQQVNDDAGFTDQQVNDDAGFTDQQVNILMVENFLHNKIAPGV